MKIDKLFAIAKTIKVNLHNQNYSLKLEIEYLGTKGGKDLFQVTDNLGRFYASQNTLNQVIECLKTTLPMEVRE